MCRTVESLSYAPETNITYTTIKRDPVFPDNAHLAKPSKLYTSGLCISNNVNVLNAKKSYT